MPGVFYIFELYFTWRVTTQQIKRSQHKMINGYINDPLIEQLRTHEIDGDSDFWSFKKSSPRRGAHAFLHYPAMMVPSLQGLILESITQVSPTSLKILDPFVGSGTVLVEAMERGLNFDGVDINPLAGLACMAKSGPYFVYAFDKKKEEFSKILLSDKHRYQASEFKGIKKWFSPEVSSSLAKIQHHIRSEPSLWARRLFWLALCRVIRLSCNSRMSTYKLHIKSDITKQVDPCSIFCEVLNDFSKYLHEQRNRLSELGFLRNGRYTGEINIEVADNTSINSKFLINKKYDVVMTSPPYGDNSTTIPYGQYAYLPLNWIDIEDIEGSISEDLFSNTHAIDAASLGGSLKDSLLKKQELIERHTPARNFVKNLGDNIYGIKRFSAFFWDLEKSIKKISSVTEKGGYQTWTIANRKIGGMTVPMESLLQSMLENEGMQVIGKIDRQILNKKMPTRNKTSDTMTSESILLARMH